uniref:C-type lectin domain-containing protein n=1 Tax=Steinernema glaseri TaxID=37863 RepID=A0A1I7ZE79_9BILA
MWPRLPIFLWCSSLLVLAGPVTVQKLTFGVVYGVDDHKEKSPNSNLYFISSDGTSPKDALTGICSDEYLKDLRGDNNPNFQNPLIVSSLTRLPIGKNNSTEWKWADGSKVDFVFWNDAGSLATKEATSVLMVSPKYEWYSYAPSSGLYLCEYLPACEYPGGPEEQCG